MIFCLDGISGGSGAFRKHIRSVLNIKVKCGRQWAADIFTDDD
jgi:hypothetical protein